MHDLAGFLRTAEVSTQLLQHRGESLSGVESDQLCRISVSLSVNTREALTGSVKVARSVAPVDDVARAARLIVYVADAVSDSDDE